jgi:hypothetical protein
MKTILSLRRHHYLKTVSIFMIAVMLIVGVVSCEGIGEAKYHLTMAVTPAGAGTATDLTGASPYALAAAVNITATAIGSYQFCEWTSSGGGVFANPNAATTTFIMPAQNVTVTAHFVGPLDHLKCYNVTDATSLDINVSLKDQFIELDATVTDAALFCNPTEKVHYDEPTLISNDDLHYTLYHITHTEYGRLWNVEVTNQFNEGEPQYLTVGGPVALAVPTHKLEPGDHEEPKCGDHFLVYAVVNEVWVETTVDLKDEFGTDQGVGVGEAVLFANPVQKTIGSEVTEIKTDEHVVFYKLYDTGFSHPQVDINNQFDNQTLYLEGPAALLGAPSEKVNFGEQLDHFTCYPIITEGPEPPPPPPVLKDVILDDQFVDDLETTVTWAIDFCNPAAKTLTESWPPIVFDDYHLTLYGINYTPTQAWVVWIDNQFGKNALLVSGPVGLAVPTQKVVPGDHDTPDGLNHFSLYYVEEWDWYEPIPVSLKDQFTGEEYESATVMEPHLLAVPVEKTVGPEVTPITNPLTHVLFYKLVDTVFSVPSVVVVDQFHDEEWSLPLDGPSYMLGVPSLKIWWEPWMPG